MAGGNIVEEEREVEKAQVSITWVPWVLMILMDWPLERRVAVPWRAGMVWIVGVDIEK
jgi:hypothetical protein